MVIIKKTLGWIGMIFGATVLGVFTLWQVLLVLLTIFIIIVMSIAAFLPERSTEKNQDNLGGVHEVYSDGRKTIVSFGKNKRFAIERGVWSEKEKQEVTWCLFDREKNGIYGTLDYIQNYKQVSPYVYTKGEKGYTKLNFETAEIKQDKDINQFSEDDQKIFYLLDQGKGIVKN